MLGFNIKCRNKGSTRHTSHQPVTPGKAWLSRGYSTQPKPRAKYLTVPIGKNCARMPFKHTTATSGESIHRRTFSLLWSVKLQWVYHKLIFVIHLLYATIHFGIVQTTQKLQCSSGKKIPVDVMHKGLLKVSLIFLENLLHKSTNRRTFRVPLNKQKWPDTVKARLWLDFLG